MTDYVFYEYRSNNRRIKWKKEYVVNGGNMRKCMLLLLQEKLKFDKGAILKTQWKYDERSTYWNNWIEI